MYTDLEYKTNNSFLPETAGGKCEVEYLVWMQNID